MEGEKEAPETSVKVIKTGDEVTRVRIFHFSCLLPESTSFRGTDMPVVQKEAGVWRILIVAGNFTHFQGDLDIPLWDFFLKGTNWDHIIYVPGPIDYGAQTVALGDRYLGILSQYNPDRFTVLGPRLGPHTVDSILFVGPKLLVAGANCWPATEKTYFYARVYERDPDVHASEADALLANHLLTEATAATRLREDIASLVHALERPWKECDVTTRVVVTYGCPSGLLSLKNRPSDPFNGTFSSDIATFASVDHWIYGANGDATAARLGNCKTIYRKNLYLSSNNRFEVMKWFDIGTK